jgi:hypothetical protein
MEITMDDSRINNISQIKEFLKGSQQFDFSLKKARIEEKYKLIDKTVKRLKYHTLRKKEKRVVINYLKKIVGYKKSQLLKLVNEAVLSELKRKKYKRVHPRRIYTLSDIKLFKKTDELHLRLS